MPELTIRVITEENEFAALATAWNSLLVNSYANNIFLTWECIFSWWQAYRTNKKLLVIAIEKNKELIGLAPLYITKARFFGIRKLKHIEFIGSTGASCEYLDFILLKGREQECTFAILDTICGLKEIKWDVINLLSIKEDSQNLAWIKKYYSEKMIPYSCYGLRESFYIPIPETMDEFYKTLSRDRKNKFKRSKAILEEKYTVSLQEVTQVNDLEQGYKAFIELHQKRWEQRGSEGSFAQENYKFLEFHNNIVKHFFKNGWLFIIFLKVNDVIVAGQYDFIYDNKLYCYQKGFDPAWEKYSIGSVLQLCVLEYAIKNKLKEFDYLRGNELYKSWWTKSTRKCYDIAAWNSNYGYHLVNLEKKIRRSLRLMLPKRFVLNLYNKIFVRKDD